MALSRLFRRKVGADYGRGVTTLPDAQRALRKALKRSARHAQRAGDAPTELCLVGQVRTGPDYVAQRKHWLRRAKGWTAQGWPERLRGDQYALFLAPVEPSQAVRRRDHPRAVVEPVIVEFDQAMEPEASLAVGITVWLQQVANRELNAVALAPPILERYAAGRLLSRESVDLGLDWPLDPVPGAL